MSTKRNKKEAFMPQIDPNLSEREKKEKILKDTNCPYKLVLGIQDSSKRKPKENVFNVNRVYNVGAISYADVSRRSKKEGYHTKQVNLSSITSIREFRNKSYIFKKS